MGLDKENRTPDTKLLYVTTGILKASYYCIESLFQKELQRMLVSKKFMAEWTHIILDEVHDREEDMDLVMLICKELLKTNSPATKLVLMSATMNEEKFKTYFSIKRESLPGIEVPPLVQVKGREGARVEECYWHHMAPLLHERFPKLRNCKELFDLNEPSLSDGAVHMCKALLENLDKEEQGQKQPGAVLIFLPGIQEIRQVRDFLMEEKEEKGHKWERGGPKWVCIPLHSSIPWEEHSSIFPPLPFNQRKIILSTNIAESSLTIPDIQYVVDFCLTKNLVADLDTHYPRLVLDWASQSQMAQRKGRAGRVDSLGATVFRLVPDQFCQKLVKDHKPEMLRVPLTKVVLDVKLLDMGSPKNVLDLAMDPPESRNVSRTVLALQEMGALLTTVDGRQDREDGDLTVLGEVLARLPVDVRLGKLIILGHIFGVLVEAVIIAAGLNGKSIFTSPFNKRVQAYKNRLYWADRSFSDCFAILNAFRTWERMRRGGDFDTREMQSSRSREASWCRSNFLQLKQLDEMRVQVDEISRNLTMMDITPIQGSASQGTEEKFFILQLIMFGAFYPNYFVKSSSYEVDRMAHKTLEGHDPRNTVYLHGFDKDQTKFGRLYANQLRQMLADVTRDEDKIKLDFSGAHIFVEFQRAVEDEARSDASYKETGRTESNLTGNISTQVIKS